MNEHSLRLLDFQRIREDLAGYCLSEEGRASVLASLPLVEPSSVLALKAAAISLRTALSGDRPLPELAFPPLDSAVKAISKEGMSLEIEELYALGLWAESFRLLGAWLAAWFGSPARAQIAAVAGAGRKPVGDKEGAPAEEGDEALAREVEALPDLSAVTKIAFRIINKDGSLRDLPELREARERIARAHKDISAIADSFFRNPETRSLLQSDEPTLRDGRTVLALRANFRGRIKGIVHEVSATGQTVFVEPEELVSRNNDLVQEEARYRLELSRILREACSALHPHFEAFAAAREAMARVDGVLARARQAKASGWIFARDLEEGFNLRTARHPALGPRAVPIDVELPPGTRVLLVTGPNTGGKTVTLKTIGLLALMNQFGLALPAAPETAFSVFDSIFADIGDEQSIDQSLSTFSGHMRIIGSICGGATPRSLVLLDELGSGTDPEEGSAVAMGLLDFFIDRGSLTILTTHHSILKNYGYTRPGCLNASMDFDATSLQPTYRVLMGVPGESRALDIAVQHGLPLDIVRGARKYLAEERADVSELIRGLSERHRKLEDMESERRERLREAKDAQRRADLSRLKVRQKEIELREQGVGELRRLLSESRKTLENLVRDLREGGITPERTREVKAFLADFAQGVEEAEGGLEDFRNPEIEAAAVRQEWDEAGESGESGGPGGVPKLGPGVRVIAGKSRASGVVVRAAKKGSWIVETETMRLTLPESELSAVATSADEARGGRSPSVAVELAPREATGRSTAVFELDLRGFRLAEALEAVEKQIDAASLQGLSLFSLLHGTGNGVLGKGIHEFLRGQPGVADYHFARPEEGGYGKTVVRLK